MIKIQRGGGKKNELEILDRNKTGERKEDSISASAMWQRFKGRKREGKLMKIRKFRKM